MAIYTVQHLTLAAIGTLSLFAAIGGYRWHDESDLFALISAGCWIFLTLLGDGMVTVTDSGTLVEVSTSLGVRLFYVGLVVVSAFVLIGKWTGKWPAKTRDNRGVSG